MKDIDLNGLLVVFYFLTYDELLKRVNVET